MKAVLLAAGEGLRLMPMTASRPKHLIPVGGKPLLEHCLDALKANGITEAVIVTHYMADKIQDYFGDGTKLGFKIEYIKQKEILGTGNAASVAEPYVEGDFLLVYGDLLFSVDALKTVLETYKIEKPDAVMATVTVENPESYGIIELGKDKAVKRIIEKPRREKTPSNLANAGLYIFQKEVFETLRQVKRSVRGEWELTDAITLLATEGKRIVGTEIARDDWFDIGRPWDLLEANAWVLHRTKHKILGNVEQGAHLLGPVTVAETARVRSGAYVEGPTLIDEGADVGPNCFIRSFTSIGKSARIGNACEVKNSIIMDGTHIGHLSYVGDSILCEHCNLGAGTITANLRLDKGPIKMMVKDKLVNTGRRKLGAILGDNVQTGIGALFMPGVKVGNDTWVGAGYIVDRDLPADSMALLKQNLRKKEREK